MTFLDALKVKIGDTNNKVFSDTEYTNYISLVGGDSTDEYKHDDTSHIKTLELAEKEVLQAILNNQKRFNSFKEGAYSETLDFDGIQRRIEEIRRKYRVAKAKAVK